MGSMAPALKKKTVPRSESSTRGLLRGPGNGPSNQFAKWDLVVAKYREIVDISDKDEEEIARAILHTHLATYFNSRDFLMDFKKARKSDPKFVLNFASERLFGRVGVPGQDQGGGAPRSSVAVLVQVLSGSKPQDVEVDAKILPNSKVKKKVSTKKGK